MEVSVHTGAGCSYQSCKEGHSQMPEVIVQQSAVHHVPEDSNASWLTQRVSYRETEKHRPRHLNGQEAAGGATATRNNKTPSWAELSWAERGGERKRANSIKGNNCREITENASSIVINIDLRGLLTLHVMTNTDRLLVCNQYSEASRWYSAVWRWRRWQNLNKKKMCENASWSH